jgi:hypothetical protein
LPKKKGGNNRKKKKVINKRMAGATKKINPLFIFQYSTIGVSH